MKLAIRRRKQLTWWHWSVLSFGGFCVTYLWLWMLTINPAQQPEIDKLAVDLILEMPRLNIEKATEQPVSVSPPTPVEETVVPAILPPKLRTPVPVAPQKSVAAQKIAPPLPDLQPAVASALISSPPEIETAPQPPVAAATGLDDPVPVSRLTRTPAFVHKALPNDPEDVQIPPGVDTGSRSNVRNGCCSLAVFGGSVACE